MMSIIECACGCGETLEEFDYQKRRRRYIYRHHNKKPGFESFWEKVDKSGECWLWTGAKSAEGYGMITVDQRGIRAHRYAYKFVYGKVLPDELSVLHKCDTPLCVREDHLYAGTQADNMEDRGIRSRTAKGEKSGACKFSDEYISEIRKYYKDNPTESIASIGRKFGIVNCYLGRVLKGRYRV